MLPTMMKTSLPMHTLLSTIVKLLPSTDRKCIRLLPLTTILSTMQKPSITVSTMLTLSLLLATSCKSCRNLYSTASHVDTHFPVNMLTLLLIPILLMPCHCHADTPFSTGDHADNLPAALNHTDNIPYITHHTDTNILLHIYASVSQ